MWLGFSTGQMWVWLAKEPTYKVKAAEGRQVFPQVSYVHRPGRMFSGGHRFIMSERVKQKTWKTLEEIQHSLSLEQGYCLELVLTGIFCTKSSIKWCETKSVRLRHGCSFRGWGSHFSLKKRNPLLLLYYFSWSIWELANWFDKTVIDLSD